VRTQQIEEIEVQRQCFEALHEENEWIRRQTAVRRSTGNDVQIRQLSEEHEAAGVCLFDLKVTDEPVRDDRP
jgi:hypothetical protein